MFRLFVIAIIGLSAWHFSFEIADIFASSEYLFVGFLAAVGLCLVKESFKRAGYRTRRF